MEGIEAAARRGACEALGDLAVTPTTDIVHAVVARLGKSRLNISKEVTEFTQTSLTSLREANASLKDELKGAHAEGDAKERRIVDLEAKLAEATSSAHEWHLKAKQLETQLQAPKANEEWARSIIAHSVTRFAPPPQGSGSQGSGCQGSQSASPARGLPPKPVLLPPSNPALAALCRELVYRKLHILVVQVHNVQFGATQTHRQGKDFRCARLCSGNERQRQLVCLSNAHAHATHPRWFHWSTIQVVQAIPHKECWGIGICGILPLFPPFASWGRIVEGRSVLNQVDCSIVPCKGPRCGCMYMEEVLWMPRPTRVGRDWFLTPNPTMGLAHGGGSAMPLFSATVATRITSLMNLLKRYWPMAFVLGATREHRILLVYGRIPPSIRSYTCQYTAVYWKYTANHLH